jgi:hypothetical protein
MMRGGIDVANGQITHIDSETIPRQRTSELSDPNLASAKIPNTIRPAADARLYLDDKRYVFNTEQVSDEEEGVRLTPRASTTKSIFRDRSKYRKAEGRKAGQREERLRSMYQRVRSRKRDP